MVRMLPRPGCEFPALGLAQLDDVWTLARHRHLPLGSVQEPPATGA